MVDYDQNDLPNMIKTASSEERYRMGWSEQFHPGSDLNQIIGELIDQFGDMMPPDLVEILSPLVIKIDKEFEFAISSSNDKTTGSSLSKLLKNYCHLD